MHDDRLDPSAAGFVQDLRTAFASTEAPPAGAQLRAAFDGVTATTRRPVARAARPTERSRFMFLEVFKSLPSKISAAALGAAIAISGLGAAGALPGSMVLTSNEAEEVELVEEDAVKGADEGSEAGAVEEREGSEGVESGETGPSDEASPVATAAQNHEFDEACGNHGAYVSHFARHGEAPECAGGVGTGGEAESTTTDADGETEDAHPRGNAKSADAGSARPAGKGKGGRP